ncbi:Altered inheritance of mitochondria protein 6 [Arachnomyces sp. PD_36]|nr:Altered inheritance of mitochondria protein 6 [Arachnomyces sp. PD_36]
MTHFRANDLPILASIEEAARGPDGTINRTLELIPGIAPKQCHSHNDYWRRLPLYDALTVGCSSVEADVWAEPEGLLVGHDRESLKENNTLQGLYIDPLVDILEERNKGASGRRGVFNTDPDTTLVLLIDLKTDGQSTWPLVNEQLQPFRERGWLTYYDGDTVIKGPITVVGTGNTPFDLLTRNETYRDVFYDAPLDDLQDKYDTTNSYYASVSLKKVVGYIWFGNLNIAQYGKLKAQIADAKDRGLVSRYWDIPDWPVAQRDYLWGVLMSLGVGMLNVDDLERAAWRNWGWCTFMGIDFC